MAEVGSERRSSEPAPKGRIDRIRTRAERLADSYEELARRRPMLGMPLLFGARYVARQGMLLASAVAFRLFLWLLPTALLAAGILAGIVGRHESTVHSAVDKAGITGTASREVFSALQQGGRNWWIAVIIGAFGVLWTGRTLARNLTLVHAHAWGLRLPKVRQVDHLVTALFCVGGWLAMILLALFTAKFGSLGPIGYVIAAGLQVVGLSAVWLGLSLRLPHGGRDWTDLLPGSVLFGLSLALAQLFSRIYLPRRIAHSSSLYGALGTAATMLGWLLIIGQIIVSAVLVNSIWSERRGNTP